VKNTLVKRSVVTIYVLSRELSFVNIVTKISAENTVMQSNQLLSEKVAQIKDILVRTFESSQLWKILLLERGIFLRIVFLLKELNSRRITT